MNSNDERYGVREAWTFGSSDEIGMFYLRRLLWIYRGSSIRSQQRHGSDELLSK